MVGLSTSEREEKAEREEKRRRELGALTPALSHQNGRGRKRKRRKTPSVCCADTSPGGPGEAVY